MLHLRTWRLWAILAATVLAIVVAAHFARPKQAALTPRADNEYIDATLCAGCHARIYQTYRGTGMARSFYRPTPRNTVEDYAKKNRYYHRASDTYYAMLQRGGKYYQRRWQIGFANQETNAEEWKIDYVMGSGNHVRTYLHRTIRSTLIELPLAWYAGKGRLLGDESRVRHRSSDHSGERSATIACSATTPIRRSPPATTIRAPSRSTRGALPEGIDCQRCHGPGGNHVRAAQIPGAKRRDLRSASSIRRGLAADRQMEVCMQCHLETTSFPLPECHPPI